MAEQRFHIPQEDLVMKVQMCDTIILMHQGKLPWKVYTFLSTALILQGGARTAGQVSGGEPQRHQVPRRWSLLGSALHTTALLRPPAHLAGMPFTNLQKQGTVLAVYFFQGLGDCVQAGLPRMNCAS